jgi:glycosyltransferase involved in cell wall biosynthesis
VSRPVIAVSFGHLSSFEAGLGEFARRLGQGLARQAPAWRDRGIGLCFHLDARLHGAFGPDVDYLPYRSRDRLVPWRLPGCVLWHNTFQHNISRPPSGVRHRILTVHDLNYRYAPFGPGPLRDAMLTRLAIARSTSLVAISRYVEDDIRRHVGGQRPIRTIHNGASDLSATPQEPVPWLVGRPFMFHVSRMAPSKNVRAIVELARSWPERTFVLAGPPWGHSKQLHDELAGTMPNVHVLLGIDDAVKAWLLQHCEAFLFPSLTEGFGLPPIEAMYFGTPVFLSDRTSLPEIGADEAGYFLDFSPSAMRSIIERELPRLQARRGDIRRRAGMFDWRLCVSGYVALYAKLLPNELTAGSAAGAIAAESAQRQVN